MSVAGILSGSFELAQSLGAHRDAFEAYKGNKEMIL